MGGLPLAALDVPLLVPCSRGSLSCDLTVDLGSDREEEGACAPAGPTASTCPVSSILSARPVPVPSLAGCTVQSTFGSQLRINAPFSFSHLSKFLEKWQLRFVHCWTKAWLNTWERIWGSGEVEEKPQS